MLCNIAVTLIALGRRGLQRGKAALYKIALAILYVESVFYCHTDFFKRIRFLDIFSGA